MRTKVLLSITALSFLTNGFLGYQALKNREPAVTPSEQLPYLSKRIFTENQNDILINFIPLRTALREYVQKLSDPLGVYFEYLPSGISIGVNDNLEVKLASLIKIPLVMAVYKQIEEGKIRKDDLLTIKQEHLDKKFGNLWKRGEGAQITVAGAMHLVLQESDNTASKLLASQFPPGTVDQVFDILDIPIETEELFPILSPKNYSSTLRSLYLSSYLTREHSNEILELLTQTKLNDKIPAGVEKNIKVAHKIGVFNAKNSPTPIFSDCGIVYVPQRPYILCIMTKSSEDKAREYIQHLSKMVYGYVVRIKGAN